MIESTGSELDPFKVLGLAPEASEDEVRARYLALVKQYTPDHHPEKFQQIRAAYEAASDPLVAARQMIAQVKRDPIAWEKLIADHERRPPSLTPEFVLSLGNRASTATPVTTSKIS